jgi:hypothetical protein
MIFERLKLSYLKPSNIEDLVPRSVDSNAIGRRSKIIYLLNKKGRRKMNFSNVAKVLLVGVVSFGLLGCAVENELKDSTDKEKAVTSVKPASLVASTENTTGEKPAPEGEQCKVSDEGSFLTTSSGCEDCEKVSNDSYQYDICKGKKGLDLKNCLLAACKVGKERAAARNNGCPDTNGKCDILGSNWNPIAGVCTKELRVDSGALNEVNPNDDDLNTSGCSYTKHDGDIYIVTAGYFCLYKCVAPKEAVPANLE